MADHFTILGRVLLMREPPSPGSNGTEEPRCRIVVGFDVAFHKVSRHVQPSNTGVLSVNNGRWFLEVHLHLGTFCTGGFHTQRCILGSQACGRRPLQLQLVAR